MSKSEIQEESPMEVYDANTTAPLSSHKAHHASSIRDVSSYWSNLATSKLEWFAPHVGGASGALSGSLIDGSVSWFAGGKLNVCHNAVDRYCHAPYDRGNDVAIVWEGDEPTSVLRITYDELRMEVCRISNALMFGGVRRGDVVTLYMPMVPELAMTMLACARIGAVHSVIFAGFSADAIADRIQDANSFYVVTASEGRRGGRVLPLKSICDDAISKERCANIVRRVFVFDGKDEGGDKWEEGKEGKHVRFTPLVASMRPVCPCVWMDAEDPLFILYTSGSTGRPKGLVHTTGGYALFAMVTTANSFGLSQQTGPSDPHNMSNRDVYACVADAGWITGHTYIVYGPLLNGLSTFMFESTPMYPDCGRYWDMVQRHGITVFYTAPTAIRSLMRYGDDAPRRYDLSSLRVLGTVGEPINPAAWKWYYDVIGNGRCSVVDTYWQTETGGHVIANLPGITPMKPGSCTLPCYGIDLAVLDPTTGKEIETSPAEGVLAIKQPWPGMARTCLGDHQRYLAVYMKPYPGYYFTGDGCRRDEDGYIWITGRVDDVLNVSGHRIGTAEVESALVAHYSVAQAAVVGIPHEIKGQGICCYVTLVEGYPETDALVKELYLAVRTHIGPFATPDMIVVNGALPMTRSGKIMRRILRKIASSELDTIGDTTTLSDPSVVDELILKVDKFFNTK
ncbi:hypothetical protein ACHAXA_008527 [Cyclostephanos tholiformis]|uniref:Acetyl-coenzyme A synthetase n=1 Tax=Cyclostephanos tholiformis TaxID=382380 RepID=A0ABD3R483_9STRA